MPTRPITYHIDQRKDHRTTGCPDRGGAINRRKETRTRHTEDIPAYIEAVVTEHTFQRDSCPNCRKMVEPKVPDALPKATFGNRVVVMRAWPHDALGDASYPIVDIAYWRLGSETRRFTPVRLEL